MIEIDESASYVLVWGDDTLAHISQTLKKKGYVLPYLTLASDRFNAHDCLAKRLPNLYGHAFGGIENICIGYEMILNSGEVLHVRPCPRSAVGPSLKNIFMGSGHEWGIFSKAYFKILPKPETEWVGAFSFPTYEMLLAYEQQLLGRGFYFPLYGRSQIFNKVDSRQYPFAFLFMLWGKAKWVRAKAEAMQDLAKPFAHQGVESGHAVAQKIKKLLYEEYPPPLGRDEIKTKEDILAKRIRQSLFKD